MLDCPVYLLQQLRRDERLAASRLCLDLFPTISLLLLLRLMPFAYVIFELATSDPNWEEELMVEQNVLGSTDVVTTFFKHGQGMLLPLCRVHIVLTTRCTRHAELQMDQCLYLLLAWRTSGLLHCPHKGHDSLPVCIFLLLLLLLFVALLLLLISELKVFCCLRECLFAGPAWAPFLFLVFLVSAWRKGCMLDRLEDRSLPIAVLAKQGLYENGEETSSL